MFVNVNRIRSNIPEKANSYCLETDEYLIRQFGRISVYRNGAWVKLNPNEVRRYLLKETIWLSHLDAYELIERVGGLKKATEIVFGGLEPKQSGFWYWDVERQDLSLVSNENCIYIPDLRDAIRKIGKD